MSEERLAEWYLKISISKRTLKILTVVFTVLSIILSTLLGLSIYYSYLLSSQIPVFPQQSNDWGVNPGDYYIYYGCLYFDSTNASDCVVGKTYVNETHNNPLDPLNENETYCIFTQYSYSDAGGGQYKFRSNYPTIFPFNSTHAYEEELMFPSVCYRNYEMMKAMILRNIDFIEEGDNLTIFINSLYYYETISTFAGSFYYGFNFYTSEYHVNSTYYTVKFIFDGYVIDNDDNDTTYLKGEWIYECNSGVPLERTITLEQYNSTGHLQYRYCYLLRTIFTSFELPTAINYFI